MLTERLTELSLKSIFNTKLIAPKGKRHGREDYRDSK